MWPRQSRGHIKWFLYGKYTILRDFYILKIDVFLEICFIKIIYKPYHENRNKIPDRSVVLMSEIDMRSLELWSILFSFMKSQKVAISLCVFNTFCKNYQFHYVFLTPRATDCDRGHWKTAVRHSGRRAPWAHWGFLVDSFDGPLEPFSW